MKQIKKIPNCIFCRGKEKNAMKVLGDMRTSDRWVLLQNDNLTRSFMPKLEEIVENFDTN